MRIRRFLVVPLAAVALVAATPPGSGLAPSSTTSPAPSETADPLRVDETTVSAQTGIPQEEVVLADKLDPVIDAFDVEVQEKTPDTYGGLYIDYLPFRVVLLTTSLTSVESMTRDEKYAELASFLVVTQVDLPLDALVKLRREVLESGIDQPAYGSDIDVATNQVLLLTDTDSRARLTAQLQDLLQHHPTWEGKIRIEDVGSPVGPQATQIYGGLHLSIPWPPDGLDHDCTSGFSVQKIGGVEGVLTAGHCMNTAGYVGNELVFKEGWNGTNTDAQWFGTPGLDDMPRVADGPVTWRYIEGKQGRAYQHKGDSVCHWGLGLDAHQLPMQCGDIESVNYAPSWVPNATSTYIRVNADCAGGDSGGPWFKGHDAYGVHSGGNELGGLCAYTAINWPLDRFDLILLMH